MFRVEFLVDDKKLPNALRAVASAGAYNVQVVPVVGAEAANGKVRETAKPVTGLPPKLADLWQHISGQNVSAFDKAQLVAWLAERGMSTGSTSYALKFFQEAKLVKMISRGKYEVRQ